MLKKRSLQPFGLVVQGRFEETQFTSERSQCSHLLLDVFLLECGGGAQSPDLQTRTSFPTESPLQISTGINPLTHDGKGLTLSAVQNLKRTRNGGINFQLQLQFITSGVQVCSTTTSTRFF
ncbi:uncharacterized protein LOC144199488 [Stigmatopora nigra]